MRALVFMLLICLGYLSVTHAQMDTLNGEPVYTIVEEMPFLKCCGGAKDIFQCTNDTITEFIDKHLDYSNLCLYGACTSGGLVVIGCIINKEGKVVHAEVVRDIFPMEFGFGDEAKRVIELMGMKMDWVAGRKAGEPVLVRFNIPVSYKFYE